MMNVQRDGCVDDEESSGGRTLGCCRQRSPCAVLYVSTDSAYIFFQYRSADVWLSCAAETANIVRMRHAVSNCIHTLTHTSR